MRQKSQCLILVGRKSWAQSFPLQVSLTEIKPILQIIKIIVDTKLLAIINFKMRVKVSQCDKLKTTRKLSKNRISEYCLSYDSVLQQKPHQHEKKIILNTGKETILRNSQKAKSQNKCFLKRENAFFNEESTMSYLS